MIFHLGIDAGFFTEYTYMLHAMLYCLQHKIQFKLYSDDANFGWEKGWTDCFVPFCEEVHEAKQRGVFAPLYLELTSGLRRGELLALLWKDLNVKERTLSVTKSVCRIDHQLVVSQPKTKNSLRLLTLPESTVQILVEEHEKHPDNPYMFPSPKTGEMLDPASFRAMHDRILEAIGAEHVRFHDMRHTFATLALKNGVDVRTLSEMLGHYSAGFTLSTYVHSTPGMKQSAADAIGNTIRNAI